MLAAAAEQVLGADAVVSMPSSPHAKDFAWYLESEPGSLAFLGTRVPGSDQDLDTHHHTFDVDESAIGIGIKVMAATALAVSTGLFQASVQQLPDTTITSKSPAHRIRAGARRCAAHIVRR